MRLNAPKNLVKLCTCTNKTCLPASLRCLSGENRQHRYELNVVFRHTKTFWNIIIIKLTWAWTGTGRSAWTSCHYNRFFDVSILMICVLNFQVWSSHCEISLSIAWGHAVEFHCLCHLSTSQSKAPKTTHLVMFQIPFAGCASMIWNWTQLSNVHPSTCKQQVNMSVFHVVETRSLLP